ncbi:2-oxyglutarate/Fe(II) oxygenase [Nitzschia inconspicua]|uniref:2-oxyglutarate/Fe(II) oxygenase n=1 Tax=Nitzschia inconspicua TaxID=303405 RepID=A0A9K3KW97_9STRA|nr:2-oxyglutarate/Fe(II) oxygenase [Nitzschia inconspicua]
MLSTAIPLIELSASIYEDDATGKRMQDLSQRVVNALQTSGFLLVSSPFLPLDLQKSAIRVTRNIFESNKASNSSSSTIIDHPTDPKQYLMVDCHSRESILNDLPPATAPEHVKVLSEYVEALETLKMQLLECIALGLKLPSKSYLVDLHQTRNSVLRLLQYHDVVTEHKDDANGTQNIAGTETRRHPNTSQESVVVTQGAKIRCKEHSDYGSLTLLLTDGVPGLQAFVNGQWIPVPYIEGALVVNIGSLLSEWTKGVLLATLHRVVHYDVNKDTTDSSNNSSGKTRTSLAFFADPDPNVSTTLKETGKGRNDQTSSMSVAEYIQYRSGGTSSEREGVQFTPQEQGRLNATTAPERNRRAEQPSEEDAAELTALWKGALEIFLHQLLYIRKVYPRDTFASTRFLETQCHVCRHPDVVSYINEAVEAIVSELISKNDCNELVVEIYNQTNMTSYEEYYISFDPDTKTEAPIADVEKDLRDLICSVGSVGRVASTNWPDSVSFRILLQCGNQDPDKSNRPLLDSNWYRAYRKKSRADEQRRIVYDVPSCRCTFQYQIYPTETDMDTDD